MPVNAAPNASRFAASVGSLTRPLKATVVTLVEVHVKRVSGTLKHMATWKVQAPSPTTGPKSHVGSSSVQLNWLLGRPFRPAVGTWIVAHSCTHSLK